MAAENNNNHNHPHPQQQQEDEATLIPVFTVLKNNSILKNIFILINNNHDQTVLVGRHPDCDIVLTHPSVSRFHLRILRSHHSLSLFDLSSVHGTWVNGKKLEAGLSVEMKEGDTFTVGVSTRVYRLTWLPLTRAFDSQNPFVFELDPNLSGNQEHEQVEMVKDLSVCVEEIESENSIPKCDNSLLQDGNLKQTLGKEILSMEDTDSFRCGEERNSQSKDERFEILNGPFETEASYFRTRFDSESEPCECQNQALSPPYVQSVDNTEKIEACPGAELPGETNLFCTLREYLTENICLPVVEAVQGTYTANAQLPLRKPEASIEERCSSFLTNIDPASFDEKGVASVTAIRGESDLRCTLGDNNRIEDISTTGAKIFDFEDSRLLVEEAIPATKFEQIKITEGVALDSISDGEKENKCHKEFKSNWRASRTEQGNSLDEIVEDTVSKCASGIGRLLPRVESLVPAEAVLQATTTSKKENQTLQSLFAAGGSFEVEIHESHLEATENAKYCHRLGHPLDQAAEDIGYKCSGSICPISNLVELEPVDSAVAQEPIQTPQSVIAVTECSEIEIFESCIEATESDKCSHKQQHPLDDSVEYIGNKCLGSIYPISLPAESVNSSVTQEADLKISNQTPQFTIAVTGCSEMEILEGGYVEAVKAQSRQEQGQSSDEIVQAMGNKCTGSIQKISHPVESVKSAVPQEGILKVTGEKENQSPQPLIPATGCSEMEIFESCVKATDKSSNFINIWLRGKAATSPQVRTRKSRIVSASNVDAEVQMSNEKDIINKSIPKDIFSVLDDEERLFTPNNENFIPNVLHLWHMRKKGNLEEVKHSKSQRSYNSESKFSPNIYSDESVNSIPNKEKQAPKVVQERKSGRKPLECLINRAEKQGTTKLKKNRVERVPFQPLTNSGGKKSGTSGPVSATKSIDASNCRQISDKHTKLSHFSGEQKRSWDMVVDTASLLNKESRKALQLLQGLKGTRLIIPRLVIWELDSMRRQFRIFRRTSEASLALEWIEECLRDTKWWIHIQSSTEENRLIEEGWNFPGPKVSNEIASPTVKDDDILDFALLYRGKKNNRQVVLLSDDVTLKIKSMAEGLRCETVPEFCRSLVNPFSERFMWANSTPRGLTWSCQDDVVLTKYYGLPSKAGLKLIAQQILYSQA